MSKEDQAGEADLVDRELHLEVDKEKEILKMEMFYFGIAASLIQRRLTGEHAPITVFTAGIDGAEKQVPLTRDTRSALLSLSANAFHTLQETGEKDKAEDILGLLRRTSAKIIGGGRV